MEVDAWLKGKRFIHTGFYEQDSELKRKVYKELIEATIKAQGALDLAYGEELEDKSYMVDGLLIGSGFLPLRVDDERVVGREYYNGMEAEEKPKQTLNLRNIELIGYFPVTTEDDFKRNLRDISDAIKKSAVIDTISYLDDEGVFHQDGMCQITPLRVDANYLYCRNEDIQKEEKIRLRWIHFIQYAEY